MKVARESERAEKIKLMFLTMFVFLIVFTWKFLSISYVLVDLNRRFDTKSLETLSFRTLPSCWVGIFCLSGHSMAEFIKSFAGGKLSRLLISKVANGLAVNYVNGNVSIELYLRLEYGMQWMEIKVMRCEGQKWIL